MFGVLAQNIKLCRSWRRPEDIVLNRLSCTSVIFLSQIASDFRNFTIDPEAQPLTRSAHQPVRKLLLTRQTSFLLLPHTSLAIQTPDSSKPQLHTQDSITTFSSAKPLVRIGGFAVSKSNGSSLHSPVVSYVQLNIVNLDKDCLPFDSSASDPLCSTSALINGSIAHPSALTKQFLGPVKTSVSIPQAS